MPSPLRSLMTDIWSDLMERTSRDAIVLAKCMRDQPHLGMAFAAFQTERKARVDLIVQQARHNGDRKVPNPFIGFVRDLLLPTFLKAAAEGIDQMYGYQVNWNEPSGQAPKHSLELRAKSN